MELYEVMKEDSILGPFNIDEIVEFVQSGLILKRDYAYNIGDPDNFKTIKQILEQHSRNVTVEHKGNLISQLKDIGSELIIPPIVFTKTPWKTDKRLFILALVGLSLSVILSIAPFMSHIAVFYTVALYFSIIWGLFFYYLFKTDEVKFRETVLLFFSTQLLILIVFSFIGEINPFQGFYESSLSVVSLVSCIIGIGVPEEFVKALPIFFILYFTKSTLKPQTAVFYGLISGISFGVFEGVQYQLGPNFQILLDNPINEAYVYAYLSNMARLTSLPFLHAIWCGIACYFLSFAFLYPRYRVSLYTLAILISASIHGIYDWLCFNVNIPFISLPVVFVGVIMLMVYLRIDYNFHSKLTD